MILIKNGRVVDAKSNTDGILDVVIDGGKIKTIGKVEDDGSYEQVIDADGCVVAPGASLPRISPIPSRLSS